MEHKPLQVDPNFDRLELLKQTLRNSNLPNELGLKAQQKRLEEGEDMFFEGFISDEFEATPNINSDDEDKVLPNENITKVSTPFFKQEEESQEVEHLNEVINPEDGKI